MSSITHNAFCHQGTVRSVNEDAVLSHADAGVWAIADGMGGHSAGDFASNCLIRHIKNACDRYKGNYLVERLRHIVSEAHEEIQNTAARMGPDATMGTTIVILALEADNFHCFWCGDSRCYLYRDNVLHLLTEDHTVAREMEMEGIDLETLPMQERISADNALTQAIGVAHTHPELDYVTGHLYQEDRFFLCSDGINKVYSDAEIGLRFHQKNIDVISADLLNDALQATAPDNLSGIIVNV